MAVTKYVTAEVIQCLVDEGVMLIGENKVQDALKKQALVHGASQWELIGHLQSNKVKQAVTHFKRIASADSLRLLQLINEEAKKQNKVMPILLQVNIAKEESKFGFEQEVLLKERAHIFSLLNIEIQGIMVIAPYAEDPEESRLFFRQGKHLFDELKADYSSLSVLSMGMSHDYKVAIEEGSTLIRIGSLLFH